VIRFPGKLDKKLAKESEAKLRAWMETKGLTAAVNEDDESNKTSGVEAASYDPPFTPAALRRNEVLIRLK
tara:strand:- start:46 stop:255 length:210 start_codon:yes stop_codon:yes gene_type:complete